MLTTQVKGMVNTSIKNSFMVLSFQKGLYASMDSRHCGSIIITLSSAHHYVKSVTFQILKDVRTQVNSFFPLNGNNPKNTSLTSTFPLQILTYPVTSDIWSVCDMSGVLSNMIPKYFADCISTTSISFT